MVDEQNKFKTVQFALHEGVCNCFYKIMNDEGELVGNILTSYQEAETICCWLNALYINSQIEE